MLETWALKTFANLAYSGSLDRQRFQRIDIDEEILKYLFLGGVIEDQVGLYSVSRSVTNEALQTGVACDAKATRSS